MYPSSLVSVKKNFAENNAINAKSTCDYSQLTSNFCTWIFDWILNFMRTFFDEVRNSILTYSSHFKFIGCEKSTSSTILTPVRTISEFNPVNIDKTWKTVKFRERAIKMEKKTWISRCSSSDGWTPLPHVSIKRPSTPKIRKIWWKKKLVTYQLVDLIRRWLADLWIKPWDNEDNVRSRAR